MTTSSRSRNVENISDTVVRVIRARIYKGNIIFSGMILFYKQHPAVRSCPVAYRDTLLIIKRTPLGPYHRSMPRILGGSYGGGRFLMGEVPL